MIVFCTNESRKKLLFEILISYRKLSFRWLSKTRFMLYPFFAHISFYMFMVTESWLEYWVQSKWFFGNQLLHIYINVTLNYIFNMMLHLLISIFIHVWLMQRKKVIYYDTQERKEKRNTDLAMLALKRTHTRQPYHCVDSSK